MILLKIAILFTDLVFLTRNHSSQSLPLLMSLLQIFPSNTIAKDTVVMMLQIKQAHEKVNTTQMLSTQSEIAVMLTSSHHLDS